MHINYKCELFPYYTEHIKSQKSYWELGYIPSVEFQEIIKNLNPDNDYMVFEPLTKRELEVLSLLAEKLPNKHIAKKLFISPETVRRHNSNIYSKLNVNNRHKAVEKARMLGLIEES